MNVISTKQDKAAKVTENTLVDTVHKSVFPPQELLILQGRWCVGL